MGSCGLGASHQLSRMLPMPATPNCLFVFSIQAVLTHSQFPAIKHFLTLVCDCISLPAVPAPPLHTCWPPNHSSRYYSRVPSSGRLVLTNSFPAEVGTWYSQSLCDMVHFSPEHNFLNLFTCLSPALSHEQLGFVACSHSSFCSVSSTDSDVWWHRCESGSLRSLGACIHSPICCEYMAKSLNFSTFLSYKWI